MGVKNLWDILECCKKTLPLHHLQNKRFCIDLSCWIIQLQNVSKNPVCIKEKVYLRSLFHRLRALIALNCSLIFVTDGSIPAIKLSTYRRRLGSGNEVTRDGSNTNGLSSLPRSKSSLFSSMIKEAKFLGMALGIPCLNGLEEAEAQCALLNAESLCDGCFTSDSDVFLFGARTVYRDIDLGEGGYVVCYEMADIERKLGYGRNSLISLALFLGSDYSQGVNGIGQETACQIVKSIGNNHVLQQILSEGLAFAKKTRGSKKQGPVLKCNAGKENVSETISINGPCASSSPRTFTVSLILVNPLDNAGSDDQFLQVIDAYLKPKCHPVDSEAVQSVLVPHPFQCSQLQAICAKFFAWTPEKTDEYILPKIAERDLRRYANLRNTSSELGVQIPFNKIPAICPISAIVQQRKVQGRECFEVAWQGVDGLKTSVVPAELVESSCPEKIVEFMERKTQAKQQKRKPRWKPKPKPIPKPNELDLPHQGILFSAESVVTDAAVCHDPVGSSSIETNVFDLTTPSPPIRACKAAKRLQPGTGELDRHLQGLMLSTESQSDISADAANATTCHGSIGLSNLEPEVIDLSTPLPATKFQESVSGKTDVIDLSESENELSPEHARKARELRFFLDSIKGDIYCE